jgi:type VI secretion system secreted protein VgrG
MPITQNERLLKLYTPLTENYLLLTAFKAAEEISTLFRYELDLVHEETEAGHAPTLVNAEQLLGQRALVVVTQPDDTQRYFDGIVARFSQGHRDERFTYYKAVLVPKFWLLTQRAQSRIFQQKSVPDILREVLTGLEVTYEIQGTFHPRDYCVQYRETDFAFASRLMEEEGIYYYFEHTNDGHKLIVANTSLSHKVCPSRSAIEYVIEVGTGEGFDGAIHTWQVDQNLRTGKVTLWDHNFELPHRKLEADKPSRFNVGGNQQLEKYDHPGEYAKRFTGVDKSGGLQASELQKIFEENVRVAELRMQEIDTKNKIMLGSGNCVSLTAGHRFELQKHPSRDVNGNYIITKVIHAMVQSPAYISNEVIGAPYKNEFECIRYGEGQPPFRPQRATPKPIVHGSQTALVVGPAGQEIFVDKYGRVKVQFHWDRAGRADTSSSCWVRVAQNIAGTKWGAAYWPRIGQEVVIDFLEGDPDRPLIVGSVYNASEMPPYTLPDEKTKTVIFKSYSTPGGGGFNEMRVEDKKDSEQIFIHAQKNHDIRIKNDNYETIGNESHHVIVRDHLALVKGDEHLQVKGDQNEKVFGTLSLTVGEDSQNKVGMKYALDAGNEVHIKSGMNLVLETGTTLTLKVGGNFININPGGIFIKGTMVMLNSGGAAGAGAGSNPEIPKDPREADTAEPGSQTPVPPALPPPPPAQFSPAAMALRDAAQSGQPFCDI